MKKLLFMSATIFGISLSLAQANGGNFLDRVQTQLFFGQTFSAEEEETILALSSEAPRNIRTTFQENKVNENTASQGMQSSENMGMLKTIERPRSRRHYIHFRNLEKPMPFYTKKSFRIIDEESIRIVRRKDKTAHQKLMRYRAVFPAYGN